MAESSKSSRAAVEAGLLLCLALAVAAAFQPALHSASFVWDDDLNVVGNPHLRSLSPSNLRWMATAFHAGHYHPLTWLSLALDYAAWGLDVRGYHLTNLVLHVLNAWVLMFLIGELLAAAGGRAGVPAGQRPWAPRAGCLAGALLFALHPLRVESVAWTTERRDVLSALFLLSATAAYVRAGRAGTVRPAVWRALSLASLVLSLSAKAWGITFPALALLLDVYPLRRRSRGYGAARLLAEKLWYAAPAALFGVLAAAAQRSGGVLEELSRHGPLERLIQACYGLCFYPLKTVWPRNLSPLYLRPATIGLGEPRFVAAVLGAAVVTLGVLAVRRRRPWAAAVWLAYAVLVSPVLGLAQSGPQLVADRYSYLACMPFSVAAAAGLTAVFGNASRPVRFGVGAATALLLAVLAVMTFEQSRIWHDRESLWTAAIRRNPAHHAAYNNRARAYLEAGAARRALEDLNRALRLRPWYADALFNRARTWETLGREEDALADYSRALASKPGLARAWFRRGLVHHRQGRLEEARRDYGKAVARRPDYAEAWSNRGQVHAALGRYSAARADYGRALEAAGPDWPYRDAVRARLSVLPAAAGAGPSRDE